ncbi:TPA: TetR/AcrR family transcriptional regulator [Burkholderia cenocepacia]|nr:TetR/AcrR family transcriptional regulator [Burkholderia cenocepacia]HDR9889645.1 TetR/AcrR family transcriptional regulator [Burkholderia cenocepacia]
MTSHDDNETTGTTKRLLPADREQQIVQKAIEHFTRNGFSGSTRELAKQIGVSQPLLYRYFASKEALIERVYQDVFRWETGWEQLIANRSLPLAERLYAFYIDYASVILREEWTRIFIFAGLTREGINNKYLSKLRSKVFLPVLAEVRAAFDIEDPQTTSELNAEIELIWALHASIFYLGVRKWVYGLKVPNNVDAIIRNQVDMFLHGAPAVIRRFRQPEV